MDQIERRHRRGVIQTRVSVSVAVLVLIAATDMFDPRGLVALLIVAYAVLTVLLWRFRTLPITLDLLAASLVVWATGGVESSWFLLYLFPILSAARYLGARGSLVVTAFAILGYGSACFIAAGGGALTAYPFGFRVVALGAVALTAASLSRTRDRAEVGLLQAIEEIDRQILADVHVEDVMRLILDTAMEFTGSELAAIKLADGTEQAAAREPAGTSSGRQARLDTAALIVRDHHESFRVSRQTLELPHGKFLARLHMLRGTNDPTRWAAQLVPLAIGETWIGVLGVFSRRRLPYTRSDVRRLSSLAHVIAMAQKNARFYVESKALLKILYEVGEGLKSEQDLRLLFQNVVGLVSARLGSEEAALFLPEGHSFWSTEDQQGPLKKVAVAGPDEAADQALMAQEELYSDPETLSGKVFYGKKPIRNNRVDSNERHALAYATLLPSQEILHYMGAPLRIGDEVLGVIRVLNKKAKNYRAEAGGAYLAAGGFEEDDLTLLTAIATQVASAIRNAGFIEQHAYFKNLVYNSPYPIIVINNRGAIRNFNRESEKLWDLTEKDVLGRPVKEFYESVEHAKEIGRALREAAEKGEGIRDYSARIKKTGPAGEEIIPIRLSAAGFFDKDGQLAGSIGVFTDEREVLKATEAKIRYEQLTMLGKLSHTKGHDIKHDLATILVWSEILKTRTSGDPNALRAGSAIKAAAERARAKLQDMLLAGNPRPPRLNRVSLRSMLEAFETSIQQEAAAAEIDLRIGSPQGNPYVLADNEQMRQVFSNLFRNSLDAIAKAREHEPDAPRGRIELDVGIEQDHVELTWRDNGSGMSEETREKAFAPLYTTKKTGSGLGLFITRTIVEGHEGTISIVPAGEPGTSFRIRLPIHRAAEGARAAPPRTEPLKQGHTP